MKIVYEKDASYVEPENLLPGQFFKWYDRDEETLNLCLTNDGKYITAFNFHNNSVITADVSTVHRNILVLYAVLHLRRLF